MAEDKKYGFIYLWYDRKRKMYYIGSHWGTEDDGYICSSNRMRNAYRRRPEDFQRRIISRVENRSVLLEEEQKWLEKASKRKERYYNINFDVFKTWWHDENKRKSVSEKLSTNHWSKNPEIADVIRAKLSRPRTEEEKRHLSEKLKGRKRDVVLTEETRKKISENSKRLHQEQKIGMHGRSHKPETIEKIRNAQIGEKNHMFGKTHSEEAKQKIAITSKGRKKTEEGKRRISEARKGNTDWRGRKHSPESIEKIKAARKKQVFSEESKQKMRDSRLAYLERQRQLGG